MSAANYDDLRRHLGHNIRCIGYACAPNPGGIYNVAVECEDCNEVLLDFDRPDVASDPEAVAIAKGAKR